MARRGRRFATRRGVRGVITSKDVVFHLLLISREFGAWCALRCLAAAWRGEPVTFLDVALKQRPEGSVQAE